MREPIIERFPVSPGMPTNTDAYLKHVEEIFVTDAYHSLSLEGYRVSAELIERVRSGTWNPDDDETDREHRNALAARGYWQTYQVVQEIRSKVWMHCGGFIGGNKKCLLNKSRHFQYLTIIIWRWVQSAANLSLP